MSSKAGKPVSLAEPQAAIGVPAPREDWEAFRLFVEGDTLYDAMVAAIEGATNHIRMESYIFAADEVGVRFAAALAERAGAGIDVRLQLDAFGAGQAGFRGLQRQLEGSGVRLRWFRPFSPRHPLRYLQRNHRKLLVVDGREAFLGGFNIRRQNSRRLHGEARQRDTHVRVAGPLAELAAGHFDRLWNAAREIPAEAIPDDAGAVDGMDALLVPSYSRRCRFRLACLYAGLITAAARHVYLTSPYFGPETVVDDALRAAASRGVDVRLLVPRRSDPPVAGWATRAAYAPLLAAGVRVYEYLPRPLHAKTSSIDAAWSIIGSANLDYRSLFINQELMLIARDPVLSGELHAQFLRDLDDAAEVTALEWHRRGWRERGLEKVGWAARRLL